MEALYYSTGLQYMERVFTVVTVCSMEAASEPTWKCLRRVTEVNTRSLSRHPNITRVSLLRQSCNNFVPILMGQP